MGYPSWGRLAAIARDAVEARTGAGFNKRKYEELMSKELLPELFDQAQNDLGGIERLLAVLRPALVAISGTGRVYQLISKWPFRLYLTTNYDNELVRHLSAIGEHFTTLGNDQAALASINDDSSRLVCKLHGSLESPTGLVLTASQFREFKVQGVRQYFRDKLKAMFSSFAVVVIGHSLTDADLSLVLESAKETSSPERPIYMVLADVSEVEREKYLNEYNIRILSYENPDGKHSELTYMLRVLDRFIVPRTSEPLTLENPDPKEVEIASSLVLFSKLALGQHEADLAQEAIRPQVLALACDAAPNSVRISEIPARLMPEVLAHHPGVSKRVDASIETLTRAGLLVSEAESVKASPRGGEKEAALQLAKRTAEDQVFGALETRLRRDVAGVSSETIRKLRDGLRGSLLAAFRKRGLSAASLLFRSTPLDRSDMPELFEAITRSVADVTDFASRAVFVEFVMGLLAQPNEQQRAYLADMSQGFFAYHLFGLDPAGGKVRASIARETEWVCDSNVFMPLLAIACHSHGFHLDFFLCTKALGIRAVTKSRFILETRQVLM